MRAIQPRARSSKAVSSSGCVARSPSRSEGLRAVEMGARTVDDTSPRGGSPLRPGWIERSSASSTRISAAPVFSATGLAAFGIGAVAPDGDQVIGSGFAQRQLIPGQCQNAPDPALAQKSGVEIESPPGRLGLGGRMRILRCHSETQIGNGRTCG